MERISIVCFTASYLVALACELGRLVVRSPLRWLLATGFAAAGLLAHSLYLGMEIRREAAGTPLSSWYHWCLIAAWLLAALYVAQSVRRPQFSAGLFMLPLVLGLIGLGYRARGLEPFSPEQATLYWGQIHGFSLLAGTVAVSVGLVAGLMYLTQSWRLKRKLPPWQGLLLPSLESLQRLNEQSLVVSTVLLGVGLAAGLILNLVRHVGVPWSDPAVVTSLGLFLWLMATAAFNGLYRPAREGRKVAYLTVANFAFLAVVLALIMLGPSQHTRRTAASEVNGPRLALANQRPNLAEGARP